MRDDGSGVWVHLLVRPLICILLTKVNTLDFYAGRKTREDLNFCLKFVARDQSLFKDYQIPYELRDSKTFKECLKYIFKINYLNI